MRKDDTLEYLCPHCGTINQFKLDTLRDMYQEQIETCAGCSKPLALIAADGVEGAINLIIEELEQDLQIK